VEIRTLLRDLETALIRAGQPGGVPRRPPWLHKYFQVGLFLATFLLILAARANGESTGVARQLIAVLGVVPLAFIAYRPLVGWRIAWVVGLLAGVWPTPRESAWPWNPVQILVFLPVIFAVAATQKLTVSISVWAVTGVLVLAEAKSSNQAGILILLLVIMGAGDQLRRRRRAQADLAEEEERSAVLSERTRIARELHDVVAHHMSLIAVRAETAPYRLGGLGEPTREEFSQISTTAREALTEMRRLLGVLRSEQHEVPVTPQPGLADLRDLVDGARRAGTPVELTMPEEPDGLPPAVELTGYRIVQEALSNAARHAPGAPATVVLARTPDSLTITVTDTGVGRPAGQEVVPGHGMLGMRERAAMLGGELSAGYVREGGFMVQAVLPLREGTE
jgi:signal transduction histidine kinase